MAIGPLLLVIALVLFVLGAFPVPAVATRVNVISLGLAFVTAAMLLGSGALR